MSAADLEELPEGWAETTLDMMGEWATGGTPSRKVPQYFGGPIPWVKSGNLNDGLVTLTDETITKDGLKNSAAKLLPIGTLSVALYGATIGKLGILGVEAATNQACANCVVDHRLSDPKFVFLYLLSQREELIDAGQGGAQPNLSNALVRDWPIPVPPLAEQRRLVAAVERLLGRVSAARDRLNRVPATLKRFRQVVLAAACSGRLTADWQESNGVMDELLEDEDGLTYPESWQCKRTAELVEPGTAISYGIVLPGKHIPNGVPYIRGLDIDDTGRIHVQQLLRTTQEIAGKHKRSEVREGDVLLCVIRHLRVAIVPPGIDGANLTQGTVRLRPSGQLLGPYLAATSPAHRPRTG